MDELKGYKSWLSCVTVDEFGTVTLTGNISSPAGSPRWVVVRNHPDQLWTDSWALREYPFGDTPASPGELIADPTGHVFIMGSVVHNGS
jgi:hypothetical protein